MIESNLDLLFSSLLRVHPKRLFRPHALLSIGLLYMPNSLSYMLASVLGHHHHHHHPPPLLQCLRRGGYSSVEWLWTGR